MEQMPQEKRSWPEGLGDDLRKDLELGLTEKQLLDDIHTKLTELKENPPAILTKECIESLRTLDVAAVVEGLEQSSIPLRTWMGIGHGATLEPELKRRYILLIARRIVNEQPSFAQLCLYFCEPGRILQDRARDFVKKYLPPIFLELCIRHMERSRRTKNDQLQLELQCVV